AFPVPWIRRPQNPLGPRPSWARPAERFPSRLQQENSNSPNPALCQLRADDTRSVFSRPKGCGNPAHRVNKWNWDRGRFPRRAFMRSIVFHGVVFVSVVLVGGCGLSDYEKRMDEQRDRLNLIDEENAALGDLIDMPSGKDPYGNEIKLPFEIFLRLPKGVSGTFQERDSMYVFEKQPLFRYGNKTDVNVFAAWARIAEKDGKTKPKEDETLPEDFRRRVRGALVDFIARVCSVNANPPNFNQANKDPRQVMRDGRTRKLDLESLAFDDPRPEPQRSRFLVYFLT